MKKDEIKAVAEAAKGHGLAILERWLPGGKKTGTAGGEYVVKNPHRDDARAGSLSINIATGKGKDFATDEAFGDFVAVVAFAQKSGQGKAAEDVAAFIGYRSLPSGSATGAAQQDVENEWLPVLPVPITAPEKPAAHPRRGLPGVVYTYRDEAGEVLGYIYRFEAVPPKFPKKDFYPLTLNANGAGGAEWRWKSFPVPRPLYGLDLLDECDSLPAMVHEGEKAAEAGRRIVPGYVSVSWPGGAAAVGHVDFQPLKGRDVVLWPDNDEPGIAAMGKVAAACIKAGAKSCRQIRIDVVSRLAAGPNGVLIDRLAPLPKGWDCHDAMAEGWTAEHIEALLARDDAIASAGDVQAPDNVAEASDDALPRGYELDDDALYFISTDGDGGRRRSRISAWLSIPALARDAEGSGWGPVIQFKDRDGELRSEVIPYGKFIGDGTDGLKQLADLGLEIAPGRDAIQRLKGFICSVRPDRRARMMDKTGWHGAVYLFPEGAVGETVETLLYRGSKSALGVFSKRGKLTDWQESIGRVAVGNQRLVFVLSLSFSGALLKPCGAPSMAFHLVGDSSIGKSGALIAAGSVWGASESQVHSWRQTGNATEYIAARHNDALAIFDELKEVDPKEASAIAYMLSNEKGKGRAHHAGGLRDSTTWRIAMLSSGELGLADHLAAAGQKRYAGQEVRFIEIPGDAGDGHGMWSELHGLAGGKEVTDYLKKAAARYYGTAGRAFVSIAVSNLDELLAQWRRHDQAFAKAYAPAAAGGQVLRVLSSFSMVAFAGEMATAWGIVPWRHGDATAASARLFAEWLRDRPSTGNAEEVQIVAHVRNVLERNWQSRFVDWHRVTEGIAEQAAEDYRGMSNGLDEPGVNPDASKGPDLSRMAAVHDSLGFRKRGPTFASDQGYLFYVTRSRFAEEFGAKGGFNPKRVAAVLKQYGVLKCDADSTTLKERLPNGDPRAYCIVGTKLWALNI